MSALWRYRGLVIELVTKDLRLKYRNSLLGVAWSLLNPLLLLCVYNLAFKHVMRVPLEGYASFLLAGLLPWTFFAGALSSSTLCIQVNAGLVRKVPFPFETLPLSTVLFHLTQLLLALALFLPALTFVSAVPLRWTATLVLPLLALHTLFTVGCALALSALSTRWRDVTHLTEVALLLLFWLTPVVYTAEMAPGAMRAWLRFSPLALFASAWQDLLFFGRLPRLAVALGLLLATGLALALGLALFRWRAPTFAEEV